MMAGVVDVHSHLFPRWYLDRLKARDSLPFVRGIPERYFLLDAELEVGGRELVESFWELERKLGYMDREGIERTVLSLANPWLDPFGEKESVRLAERVNSEFAALAEETGGRIVGLGVLPKGSVDAAQAIIREHGQDSELRGFVTGSKICGHALDSPALEPLWADLAETSLPLFLHPRCGVALDEMKGYGGSLPVAVAFPFETTVGVARLLFGGVFHRYPGLRIVAAHGAGAIAFLIGRLDAVWRAAQPLQQQLPTPPSSSLGGLYADTVVYDSRALSMVASVLGSDHLLFGTDHPFDIADPTRNRRAIEATLPSSGAREALGRTAEKLFRLPPSRRDLPFPSR